MAICLDKIVDFDKNIYEATNAIIKRAKQITEIGDDDLADHNQKVVSCALSQILTEKIVYHIEN